MTAGSMTQSRNLNLNLTLNLIDGLAAAPGDRPFVTAWINEDERETVTFAEFRRRARRQAAVLRDQGVAAGDRVIIIMPQGIPAMTVFVGAMMLGAVPAILAYPNIKVEASKYRSGLAGVTANLRARLVVIDEDFPVEMLSHVSLSEETRLLRAGDGCGAGGESVSEPVHEKELTDVVIQSGSVAFIQHSAGTTGLQKGVALTHAAVLTQIEHLRHALKIDGATDRIYSWLPLYHDMGLIACFMLPMVCHTAVVMQPPLDWVMHPATMLQIISDHRCTLAWLPNFAFQFVPRRVRHDREQYDLSSVRALINCSEPIRASSMQEFQNAFAGTGSANLGLKSGALQTSYAMAETVFAVTQSNINRPTGPARIWADGRQFRSAHRIVPVAEGTPGSVCFVSSGQLLPNTEVRIVSDAGADLAAENVGEILVKSDCLFDGYYNRSDLTAKALVDGWYHTGDLGFYLDGELYVIGRKKDLIIVGGENIYPQDIEEIVASHPAIHEGRVIAMGAYNPDTGTEDIIMVAEVETEDLLANTVEIERELSSRITAGMGVAVRAIFLKPPKWIVKSTAGKPARSSTFEKLLQEHPEFGVES
jgi:acyl-CoA synthetase (AMP-forming)/AMP-acid ligase II